MIRRIDLRVQFDLCLAGSPPQTLTVHSTGQVFVQVRELFSCCGGD